MSKGKKIFSMISLVILTVGLIAGIRLIPQPQEIREKASSPLNVDSEDDFERQSLGNNWVINFGNVGIVNQSDIGLLSQSGMGLVTWVGTDLPKDQYAQAMISPDKLSNMMNQVFTRRQGGSAAPRYGFHYDDDPGDAQWQIKYDGVPTKDTRILAINTTSPKPEAGDIIKIEVRGDNPVVIKGYHNNNLILQSADNDLDAIRTNGRPGIAFRLSLGSTASYPSPAFENFSTGSLTTSLPSPTVPPTPSPTPTNFPIHTPTPTSIPTPTPTNAPTPIPTATSTPDPFIPGDINQDETVSILDYILLSNAFGTSDPDADINNDGTVNILDYTILSINFGATPTPSPSPIANLFSNPSFELGTQDWSFSHKDGTGSFTTSSDATDGVNSAMLTINTKGGTTQLYQSGFPLEAGTEYSLSFDAKSNSGNNASVAMIQHASPYSNYGLSDSADLTSSWQTFNYTFTTSGFSGSTTDARLRLILNDADGDVYYFDNFVLTLIEI